MQHHALCDIVNIQFIKFTLNLHNATIISQNGAMAHRHTMMSRDTKQEQNISINQMQSLNAVIKCVRIYESRRTFKLNYQLKK